MKTKLHREKGRIRLILPDLRDADGRPCVVASMEQHEGTECWQLTDIRLAPHREVSPWAGASADDFHAMMKPSDADDAEFIKSRLREYVEDADGTLHWCTFNGIVRGQPDVDGYRPATYGDFHEAGYFRYVDGFARLQEIQRWWDAYQGDPNRAKIDNPSLHPSPSAIAGELILYKLTQTDNDTMAP